MLVGQLEDDVAGGEAAVQLLQGSTCSTIIWRMASLGSLPWKLIRSGVSILSPPRSPFPFNVGRSNRLQAITGLAGDLAPGDMASSAALRRSGRQGEERG